jgi:ribosome-binding ATPase YchF (GTP1/OBG family)
VRHAYRLLGLITFFTANETEAHAWAIPDGTGAARAAGSVHSDMEQGFIRAEVVGYQDLSACGGMAQARDRGLLRVEGRDYQVRDGDTILFRFR